MMFLRLVLFIVTIGVGCMLITLSDSSSLI